MDIHTCPGCDDNTNTNICANCAASLLAAGHKLPDSDVQFTEDEILKIRIEVAKVTGRQIPYVPSEMYAKGVQDALALVDDALQAWLRVPPKWVEDSSGIERPHSYACNSADAFEPCCLSGEHELYKIMIAFIEGFVTKKLGGGT